MKTFTRSCPSFRSSKHMAERKVSRLLIGVASYVQSWCNLGLTGLWMSHCPPQSLNFFIQGLSSIESKPVRYPVLLDRNKDLVSLILAEAKRENHMPKCLGLVLNAPFAKKQLRRLNRLHHYRHPPIQPLPIQVSWRWALQALQDLQEIQGYQQLVS